MDAYNANPSSMEVAISHFLSMDKLKKVAIVGDMKELGEFSIQEHQKIMARFIDYPQVEAYFVGPEFSKINHDGNLITFACADDAVNYFNNHPIRNAYILLKGSRGIKMETILTVL
jgi:UDP-N-acetylmuramoyl-tripeptide--D-alanyl-D-alanine ligase